MSFCANCGVEIVAEDRFCWNCGAVISPTNAISTLETVAAVANANNNDNESSRVHASLFQKKHGERTSIIVAISSIIVICIVAAVLTAVTNAGRATLEGSYTCEGSIESYLSSYPFDASINVSDETFEVNFTLLNTQVFKVSGACATSKSGSNETYKITLQEINYDSTYGIDFSSIPFKDMTDVQLLHTLLKESESDFEGYWALTFYDGNTYTALAACLLDGNWTLAHDNLGSSLIAGTKLSAQEIYNGLTDQDLKGTYSVDNEVLSVTYQQSINDSVEFKLYRDSDETTSNPTINNDSSNEDGINEGATAPSVNPEALAYNGDGSEYSDDENESIDDDVASQTFAGEDTTPFWGVWTYASKNREHSEEAAQKLKDMGYKCARVTDTDNWKNLNQEHWYVVTAGEWNDEASARAATKKLKKLGEKEAYPLYTGSYMKDGVKHGK